jgi:hypothetical protein
MRPLVLTVLAALVLAGCAQPDPAPADANETAPTTAIDAASAPNDDGSSQTTIVDTGHMPHLHDYWHGKERVTLFDGDLEPDAMNLTFATLIQAFFFQEAVVGGMQFWLPDGQIVYEGTGVMELTATWTDPRVTSVGFVYLSAEGQDLHEGGALRNGEPFALELQPEQTDMPHAKTSRWWFGFGPSESPGMLAGPWHLKIDIVKVNDVMLFPAHPDFWQGAHELTLIDADHHGEVESYGKRAAQPVTEGGQFVEDWVSFPKPVPMETQAIRFTVEIKSAQSTPGEVTSFGLFYHGAETRQPFRCPTKALHGALPQVLEWTVASTMEMTDSPYSPESQWRFLVEPIVTPAPGTPEMGGMTDVSYDYHVVATALDSAPDEMDACAVDGS